MITIQTLLDEMQINKTQFAAELGVPESTVVKWIKGKSHPNCNALKNINALLQSKNVSYHIFDIIW